MLVPGGWIAYDQSIPFSFVPHVRSHVCVLFSAKISYPNSGIAIGGKRENWTPTRQQSSEPILYSVCSSKTRDADKHSHEKHSTKIESVCAEFVQCLGTDWIGILSSYPPNSRSQKQPWLPHSAPMLVPASRSSWRPGWAGGSD